MTQPRSLIGTGFAVGLEQLTNFEFDLNRPYTACLLCGVVYQSEIDRKVPPGEEPHNSLIARIAKERRGNWARAHAATEHTLDEHAELARSGRTMTPQAAQKLSAYGIIDITDMVVDDEVADALAKASSTPLEDARDH